MIKVAKGTPQGSAVSPILANIVLHEFDKYMHNLKLSFDKGSKRAVNKKYHSLNTSRHKTKYITTRLEKLTSMLKMNPKDTQDPNFRRLLYVRYADDFVVLLICGQKEAFTIRRRIKDYLQHKLGLELNLDKTKICNLKNGFKFLGAVLHKAEPILLKINRSADTKKVRKRVSRRLIINAPIQDLIQKMINNKFARRNDRSLVLAKGRKDLVNLTHYQILRFYNARIRGLLNFYSFAGNYSSLNCIV
jgi:hypothetical protein